MDSDNSDPASDYSSDFDTSHQPSCWDHLTSCLNNIKSIGDFATMKSYEHAPNPGLQIGGKLVPLPLDDHGAESIKKVGRQAPFGKGNQTLVDVTVRQTWELSVADFRLTNPAWPSFLNGVVQDACTKLGVIRPVDALPHKLLLYEPGSFFMPHKDSQNEKGMIATLVICLPSGHEGGEVHLSHAGQPRTFDTGKVSLFDTTALAWFSDVTHEVRKVVSGRRLALTYNIVHQHEFTWEPMSAAAFDQQLDKLDQALAQCNPQGRHFSRKLYPLDHNYSRAGLSLGDLKGRDRAVGQSLHKLCSRHGFYLLLSHIRREESKYPDEYYEDDNNVALSLDVINRPDGTQIAQEILFHEDELLSDPYSDRVEDSFEESEHLGNEESPEIFKYYDAALMICHKTHLLSYLPVRQNINMPEVIEMVIRDVEKNPDAAGAPDDALSVLESMVRDRPGYSKPPSIYKRIMEWAWQHCHRSLYLTSVSASVGDQVWGHEGRKAMAAIISADISNEKHETAIEWDKYFGDVFTGIDNLTYMAEFLTVVEEAIGDRFKSSFAHWRTTKEQEKFDSKKTLSTRDKGFILSGLDDSDWLTNSLVPALSTRGQKDLIMSLVKHLLEDKPEAMRESATDTADKILQGTYAKVALESNPAEFRDTVFRFTAAYDFLRLLENCWARGLGTAAAHMLDASWANVESRHADADSAPLGRNGDMITAFLEDLGGLLREHEVPRRDSARRLFALLLRRYVHAALPSYPERPRDWSRKPRGCGCRPCRELDAFLAAGDAAEREFRIDVYPGAYHVRDRLPGALFERDCDGPAGVLRVSKRPGKEFEADVDAYDYGIREAESALQGLRHAYVEGLLGEAVYRELVLLEGVRGSEAAGRIARDAVAAEVGGTKREADEVLENPTVVRARRK